MRKQRHFAPCGYCAWFRFGDDGEGMGEAVELARTLCFSELAVHASLSVVLDGLIMRETGQDPSDRYDGPDIVTRVLLEEGAGVEVDIEEIPPIPSFPDMGRLLNVTIRMSGERLRSRLEKVPEDVRGMPNRGVLGYWDLDRMERVYRFRGSRRWPVVRADLSEDPSGLMRIRVDGAVEMERVQLPNAVLDRFNPISMAAMRLYKNYVTGLISRYPHARERDAVWGMPAEATFWILEEWNRKFPVGYLERWKALDRSLAGQGIRDLPDLIRAVMLSVSPEIGMAVLGQ